MNTVYYLKTCDTCKRILKQLKLPNGIIYREIKTQPIDENELEVMYNLTQNYEILFNKKSKLYKELDLKTKNLSEIDYKKYLLDHYTFLNRPIFLLNENIFIGNSTKNIETLEKFLSNEF
jgi:arsenate reductase-like glutaredoxin family protein